MNHKTPHAPPGPGPERPRSPLEDPARFLELGQQLASDRFGALALNLAERARAVHGDDPLWQALAAEVLRAGVPKFHLRMLRDAVRNAAYRAAIDRFAPGRVVLDIGTGSGLLAMMAARAGAARVYACEANAMLAASATAVIAANGLADRITVFERHSTTLSRVSDLGGGADLVVSELFSETLIGEGVLGSLAHAHSELAAPGALFVPDSASIMIALAEFPVVAEPLGMVEGFDLGAFAGHVWGDRHFYADNPDLALRSAAAPVMSFDFGAGALPESGTAQCDLVSSGGLVNGVAQWLRLRFADDILYENPPGGPADLHWPVSVSPAVPRHTASGDRFRAGVAYAADTLVTWCAPACAPEGR